jgi:hypothetical protein
MKRIKDEDNFIEIVEMYGTKGSFTLTIGKTPSVLLRSTDDTSVPFRKLIFDNGTWEIESKGQQLKDYLSRAI